MLREEKYCPREDRRHKCSREDRRHKCSREGRRQKCSQKKTSLAAGVLADIHFLFNNCCGQLHRPKIFLKIFAMVLCVMATIIMTGQFYLYFNRIGDVFTMIALGGGVLSSAALITTHLLGCPSLEGEKLLLLVYGVLNSVIGVLLLLENLYYTMSTPYLLLAMSAKAAGIVMLIDFARNKHNESSCN